MSNPASHQQVALTNFEKRVNKLSFAVAASDMRHRTRVDEKVSVAVDLAHELANENDFEGLFGGRWSTRRARFLRDRSEALAFILARIFRSGKQRSVYLRATRRMFNDGMTGKEVIAKVRRTKGGFGALASANAKRRAAPVRARLVHKGSLTCSKSEGRQIVQQQIFLGEMILKVERVGPATITKKIVVEFDASCKFEDYDGLGIEAIYDINRPFLVTRRGGR